MDRFTKWGAAIAIAAAVQLARPARAQAPEERAQPPAAPPARTAPPAQAAPAVPMAPAAPATPAAPAAAAAPFAPAAPAQGGSTTAPGLPREHREDGFGLGVGIGKGAGLLGVFASFPVSDALGFEVGIGKRLFIVNVYGPGGYSWQEDHWPTAGVVKAQWFLRGPESRYRFGIEAGFLMAEDTGPGGEVAYFGRVRLAPRVFVDYDLGLTFWPDIEERMSRYAAKATGVSGATFEVDAPSFALMWGGALGVIF